MRVPEKCYIIINLFTNPPIHFVMSYQESKFYFVFFFWTVAFLNSYRQNKARSVLHNYPAIANHRPSSHRENIYVLPDSILLFFVGNGFTQGRSANKMQKLSVLRFIFELFDTQRRVKELLSFTVFIISTQIHKTYMY